MSLMWFPPFPWVHLNLASVFRPKARKLFPKLFPVILALIDLSLLLSCKILINTAQHSTWLYSILFVAYCCMLVPSSQLDWRLLRTNTTFYSSSLVKASEASTCVQVVFGEISDRGYSRHLGVDTWICAQKWLRTGAQKLFEYQLKWIMIFKIHFSTWLFKESIVYFLN